MTGLRPVGRRAVLVDCADLAEVRAVGALLRAEPWLEDVVPGAATVLAVARSGDEGRLAGLEALLADAPSTGVDAVLPETVIAVRYGGEDLAGVASLLGVSAEALVAQHLAARWEVAFLGFAPGFGYLVSEDWPWRIPRLDTPRQRVPAGALGLADGFTGIYPSASPGGWRLIGSSDAPLWDPAREPPTLFVPGARVRFEAVG